MSSFKWLFFSVVFGYISIPPVYGQLIKLKSLIPYEVQPYSDSALAFKEEVMRNFKFPKDAKISNVRGVLRGIVDFDSKGDLLSIKPISSIGGGIEEALVEAFEHYKKKMRKPVSKQVLLQTSADSTYLFQVPLYVSDEKVNYTTTGNFGTAMSVRFNADMVLITDLNYIGTKSKAFDFTAISFRGDYMDFMKEIGDMFINYKDLRKIISSGTTHKLGTAVIRFDVDDSGKIVNILPHGTSNRLTKTFIKVLDSYASQYRFKTNDDKPEKVSPYVLYINLRDKTSYFKRFGFHNY